MKIRVSYTVDLDQEQLDQLVQWAGSIGIDVDRPARAVAIDVLGSHGTEGLTAALEYAWEQRVELLDPIGGDW